jgi:hypothetical protein
MAFRAVRYLEDRSGPASFGHAQLVAGEPVYADGPVDTAWVHRGILTARVKLWRKGIHAPLTTPIYFCRTSWRCRWLGVSPSAAITHWAGAIGGLRIVVRMPPTGYPSVPMTHVQLHETGGYLPFVLTHELAHAAVFSTLPDTVLDDMPAEMHEAFATWAAGSSTMVPVTYQAWSHALAPVLEGPRLTDGSDGAALRSVIER